MLFLFFVLSVCLDKKLTDIFKSQITRLIIEINPIKSRMWTLKSICSFIFSVFLNLTHLIFYESSYKKIVRLLFDSPTPKISSSTLMVLNIKVQSFHVCLYLLDGRFNQLQTFFIELANIHIPDQEIENQVSFTQKN